MTLKSDVNSLIEIYGTCDPETILKELGVSVCNTDLLPPSTLAMKVTSDEETTIGILDNLSEYTRKFVLAHELGHILLHSEWTEEEYEKYHTIAEKQAHRFAASFMMPAASFDVPSERISISDALMLKDRWGMSVAAICHRMYELKKIDEQRYKSLYIDMSRRGWRKEEPGDKEHAPEHPYYIATAFKSIFDRELIAPDEIVEGFGLYPEEVIKFTGNAGYFMAMPDENIQFKEVDK